MTLLRQDQFFDERAQPLIRKRLGISPKWIEDRHKAVTSEYSAKS